MDIGIAFEYYIKELYKTKKYLTHNTTFRTEDNIRIQIDLTYKTLFTTRFVECKYKTKKIPLEDIAKFSAQLDLLDIKTKYGEVITNSYYTRRAIIYAEKKQIRLYDMSDLERLTNKTKNTINQEILTLYNSKLQM